MVNWTQSIPSPSNFLFVFWSHVAPKVSTYRFSNIKTCTNNRMPFFLPCKSSDEGIINEQIPNTLGLSS